jgi:polar amino acid transport system permease protein
MTVCNVVKGAEYLTLEPMTIVALIYLCMTFPLSKLVGYFEKKMANPNSYRSRKHNRKKEVRI